MNLKELEKKAYRSVFQDGLWDVFTGFLIGQFAVAPLLGDLGFSDFWSSAIWSVVVLAVLAVIMLLKKYVIAPRLGTVKFKKTIKSRYAVVLGLLNMFLLVGALMAAFYIKLAKLNVDWLMPFTFIFVVLASFGAVAWLFNQPRFFLYGIFCALAFAGGELLYRYAGIRHHGFPVTFGITSFLITLTGIMLFIAFIRKYPKTKSELYFEGGSDG